jgi:hypothetical protein
MVNMMDYDGTCVIYMRAWGRVAGLLAMHGKAIPRADGEQQNKMAVST